MSTCDIFFFDLLGVTYVTIIIVILHQGLFSDHLVWWLCPSLQFYSRCPCAAKVWQLNTGSVSLFLVHSLSLSLSCFSRGLVEVVSLQVVVFLHAVVAAVSRVGIRNAEHALGAVHLDLRPLLAVHVHQLVVETRGLYGRHDGTKNKVSLGAQRELSHTDRTKDWNTLRDFRPVY